MRWFHRGSCPPLGVPDDQQPALGGHLLQRLHHRYDLADLAGTTVEGTAQHRDAARLFFPDERAFWAADDQRGDRTHPQVRIPRIACYPIVIQAVAAACWPCRRQIRLSGPIARLSTAKRPISSASTQAGSARGARRTWIRAGPAGISCPISCHRSARLPGSTSISMLRAAVSKTTSRGPRSARSRDLAASTSESEVNAASSASTARSP